MSTNNRHIITTFNNLIIPYISVKEKHPVRDVDETKFHSFFIQSFSQLDSVYGKEIAQIILDNCGLIYLKTNTQETAEAISKRLGKQTIQSSSISQSISKNSYDGNRSTSLMGRDLLTAEEVKQLHHKTIIFPTIGYPIFRDNVVYTKFSCYKNSYASGG